MIITYKPLKHSVVFFFCFSAHAIYFIVILVFALLTIELFETCQVWSAYKDQKHDLFLPSNAQTAAAGIAGLIEGSSAAVKYALPSPTSRSAVVRLSGTQTNADTGAGR